MSSPDFKEIDFQLNPSIKYGNEIINNTAIFVTGNFIGKPNLTFKDLWVFNTAKDKILFRQSWIWALQKN